MQPKQIYFYGADIEQPQRLELRAGPLSMIFEPGTAFLRYIRLGDEEILRGVYSAVRDKNWGTVSPELSNLNLEERDGGFQLTFDVMCQEQEIDFRWKGTISGDSRGRVEFRMDGVAHSTFQRNRIGFCVLHPMSCAGKPCVVKKVDGHTERSRFPLHISPHQPFMEMRSISHDVLPGVSAEVGFSGDTFETEDQRNWTDASYKTYCTPLRFPYPVEVQAGTEISQSVTLTLDGDLPAEISGADAAASAIELTVDVDTSTPLPEIGLGSASHGGALSDDEIARLKSLNLAHLRLDLDLSQPDVEPKLRQASDEANALSASLEVALFLSNDAEAELGRFVQMVDQVYPPVARYLIFHAAELSTTTQWIELARGYLPDAKLVAGTNAYFTELNRERPPIELLDGVCYSINPQVHAFDNASLVETLETQGQTVESTRQFVGGLSISVTPLTLSPRFNPNATGPEPEPAPGELPSQVDPRQMSLLGAGWTLGSLKYLSESNADSLTYYETTGWRGVMETAEGSPLPQQFRSIPGGVFPLYHVLADVGEFVGGEVIASKSSEPLNVDGMVLRNGADTRILIANLSPEPQQARINCSGLGEQVSVKTLDETTVEAAMRSPETFRSEAGQSMAVTDDSIVLRLLPFAVFRIDSHHGGEDGC